jgi:hypothetical protein
MEQRLRNVAGSCQLVFWLRVIFQGGEGIDALALAAAV